MSVETNLCAAHGQNKRQSKQYIFYFDFQLRKFSSICWSNQQINAQLQNEKASHLPTSFLLASLKFKKYLDIISNNRKIVRTVQSILIYHSPSLFMLTFYLICFVSSHVDSPPPHELFESNFRWEVSLPLNTKVYICYKQRPLLV